METNSSADDRKAARQKIADYLDIIQGEDPADGDATSNIYNNFWVGVMDRLSIPHTNQNGEPKNFQGRFYRKDSTVIDPTSALWKAMPHDHDPNMNWQGTDSSISPLKENNPYEVDHQPRGLNPSLPHRSDDVVSCLISIARSTATLWPSGWISSRSRSLLRCRLFPRLPGLGPLLGALNGLAAALLAFLLQWLVDGGSDAGHATEPDIDFDDPDNFGEDGQQQDGDLVSIYGPWIIGYRACAVHGDSSC